MRRTVCVLAIMLLAACSKIEQASQADATAKPAAPASDPMEIVPNKTLLDRLKIGEPSWAEVGASITVAATIDVDDTRITRLGSPVMGRILTAPVHEGEDVTKGQVLATLNSTGLSDAQLSFLKAVSQRQLAERAVERARLLVKADVIGAAELQRREAELAQTLAEMAAARDQLQLLGMPAESIAEFERTRALNSVSRVFATMDGTVLERKVTIGQVVQPADTIYEIADLSNVWLVADVPEQSGGNLRRGQTVEAEIAAFPGRKLYGKLSFVSHTVDPKTRTVRVRMDVPNPARKLKPSMLATMELKEHTERKMLVPNSAVVREGNDEYIFIQRGQAFVMRKAELGAEYGGRRVITEGVQAGEKIVLDGAFHLNTERRVRTLRSGEGS